MQSWIILVIWLLQYVMHSGYVSANDNMLYWSPIATNWMVHTLLIVTIVRLHCYYFTQGPVNFHLPSFTKHSSNTLYKLYINHTTSFITSHLLHISPMYMWVQMLISNAPVKSVCSSTMLLSYWHIKRKYFVKIFLLPWLNIGCGVVRCYARCTSLFEVCLLLICGLGCLLEFVNDWPV